MLKKITPTISQFLISSCPSPTTKAAENSKTNPFRANPPIDIAFMSAKENLAFKYSLHREQKSSLIKKFNSIDCIRKNRVTNSETPLTATIVNRNLK